MPPWTQLERWKVIGGYLAFAIGTFVFFFFLTFPYGAVEKRLAAEASNQGLYVKFGGMGPGFFGISASNVQISKKIEAATDKPESLTVRSIALRPSLFPLGVAFRAKAFGGTITGALGGVGDVSLRLNLNDLNASDPSFRTFSGVDMAGKINGSLALDIPKSAAGGPAAAKVQEPDLSQARGTVSLKLEQLLVKGGTLTLPLYGEMTPVDLPKIALGEVQAKIKFEKGLGTIEKFQGNGEDVNLSAAGTLKLAKRIDYSEANVDIKLKAEPDFTKRLGMLGGGLELLPADKDNPGFKLAKMSGFLGRPNFNPGK